MLGPRGTGKTTYLQDLAWADKSLTLLEQSRYHSLMANPSILYEELVTLPRGSKVMIVEIQRIPELLNEVHRLIEDRNLKFALTGSSARKLKQISTNLLAGRAVQRYLFPLLPQEMQEDFNLNEALRYGTLPLVISAPEPKDTIEAYVDLYLKEEIQAEALLRNLSGFIRFLPLAALMHGQRVNLSNIAREAEVARTTVQGYFSILEDTLIVRSLRGYESKLRVREKMKPKIYFIDAGIVRACKKNLSPVSAEESGTLFEGLVFNMLMAQKEYFREIEDIYYWSPAEAQKTEVDFLILKGREKIAIEVKSSPRIRPEELHGLNAIKDLPGLKRRLVIYTGKIRRQTPDGIEILPFQDFVEELIKKNI